MCMCVREDESGWDRGRVRGGGIVYVRDAERKSRQEEEKGHKGRKEKGVKRKKTIQGNPD